MRSGALESTNINNNVSHLHAGGLISFDIFPEGWDKTLCLDLLAREGLNTIYFFGNETSDVSESSDFKSAAITQKSSGRRAPDWRVLLCRHFFSRQSLGLGRDFIGNGWINEPLYPHTNLVWGKGAVPCRITSYEISLLDGCLCWLIFVILPEGRKRLRDFQRPANNRLHCLLPEWHGQALSGALF